MPKESGTETLRTASFAALAGLRSMAAPALLSRAVLGVLSALIAAYAGEKFRTRGAEKLGAPQQFLGLLEDGIVLFGGTRLLRSNAR